jgi:FtsP/CotA-like multicopper oxidase with cupredoxin domain
MLTLRSAAVVIALLGSVPLCGITQARAETAPAPAPEHILANDNRESAGRLSRNQLRIELEAREGLWFPETTDGPGVPVQAFGERGKPLRIPGPLIRVPEGTRIHAWMHNKLDVKLTLHGFHARPGDAKATIELAPGERREFIFDAGAPGTYYYWGSTMQGGQVTGLPIYRDGPLSGGFIVDRRGIRPDPAERIFVISQWRENPALDIPNVLAFDPAQRRTFAINGLAWPFTERLTYDLHQTVRWRWINATFEWHPLHLHGFYFDIVSQGDAERDNRIEPALRPRVVTNRVDPGGTMTIAWTPDRIGNWLFHCHILDHIDPTARLRAPAEHHPASHADHAREAMSGLVMGVTVREPTGYAPSPTATAARQLKLFVQEQPRRFGEAAALGYSLKKGEQDPPPDTVDIPGPLLVLTRGEHASIEIINRTREETSVHWHGMELESYYDGVPGWGGDNRRTTPPIRPGESFVAHMTPPRAGTFIYHTHWHDVHQLSSGMYGPLVVLEPGAEYDPETERMILLSVGPSVKRFAEPVLINGSEKPAPLRMRVGPTYRLRLINITADNANLNLTLSKDSEPVTWRAIAKDGADLPPRQRIETKAARQSLTTGETRDYELRPTVAGDLKFEVRNVAGRVRGTLIIEVRDR